MNANARLEWCGLVNDAPSALRCWRYKYLAIEIPRISKQTKNPASIIRLAITAGRIEERYEHETLLETFVDQWKGSVEKQEMCARVLAEMSPAERALLPDLAKTYLHNVIDAIGIAFRAVGRMKRGKK